MPPRPHPVVVASLAFGCAVVMALLVPHSAFGAGWRWPLRGPVVGAFHVSPHAPFSRGQRRGIELSALPGTVVRAACSGRVTFAGALPHRGLAVSVRCGALMATYLGLGRLAARPGSRVAPGDGLGTLGASGHLRLGARRAAERRGYVDPLLLLERDGPALPHLGPAPRAGRRSAKLPPPATAPALLPAPAPGPASEPRRFPWPAYPALALIASALPLGGLMHRRRRRARPAAAAQRA